MATYTAVKTINSDALWNDPASWDVGSGYPGAGDTVQTGNYVITIVSSKTCALFKSTGSGYFQCSTAGVTLTGDVEAAGTSQPLGQLRTSNSTGTITLTGDVVNSSSTGYARAVTNSGAGALAIGGNVMMTGSGTYRVGVLVSAGTVTVSGNATGGDVLSSVAVQINLGGTAVVNGTATAGEGAGAYGVYTNGGVSTVNTAVGNNYGPGSATINSTPGVYSTNVAGSLASVKKAVAGPYGQAAVGGAVRMLADTTNSATFQQAGGGDPIVLTAGTGAVAIRGVGDGKMGP